jgi:hypothetical protein
MRAFPSLSGWLHGRSRRERLFLLGGATVAGVALTIAFGVVPAAGRWASREVTYAAAGEQASRLQQLVAGEAQLRRAVAEQRRSQHGSIALLVTGATPALATSSLQALLQRYAEESLVQLNRVDVAGQPRAARPGLLAVPVLLQGQGDIYGLVDFLHRLQQGEKLLVVDEMTVNPRSSWARGDQPLVLTVRAYALYPSPGGRP